MRQCSPRLPWHLAGLVIVFTLLTAAPGQASATTVDIVHLHVAKIAQAFTKDAARAFVKESLRHIERLRKSERSKPAPIDRSLKTIKIPLRAN